MSKQRLLRGLSLLISLGLMIALYSLLDTSQLWQVWASLSVTWLALAMLAVAPLLALTVWRLQCLSPRPISFWLGVRVNLQASTMNLIMPAKLGDIGKGAFLAQHTRTSSKTWLILCTFEKVMDLTALLILGTFGLLFYPDLAPALRLFALPIGGGVLVLLIGLYFPKPLVWSITTLNNTLPERWQTPGHTIAQEWQALHAVLATRPYIKERTMLMSLLLWGGHLGQIWLLAQAVGMPLSIFATAALIPLGILAGLLPFTLGGLGTRDAAFTALLASFASPAAGATLGLLTGFRYIIPALIGLPLLGKDIAQWRKF